MKHIRSLFSEKPWRLRLSIAALILCLIIGVLLTARQFTTTPVSEKGTTIYALLKNGSVAAIDGNDGIIRWTFQAANAQSVVRFTASDDNIYLRTNDTLYALRASDGTLLWKFKMGVVRKLAPLIVDHTAIYVVLNDVVVALSTRNGVILHHYQVPSDPLFLPFDVSVANGIVYATTLDISTASHLLEGALYAFNTSNGTLLWNHRTTKGGYAPPVISNGIAYTADKDSIDAFEGSTGRFLWSTSSYYPSLLSINNGVMCCRLFGSSLAALSARDGHQLWHYSVPGLQDNTYLPLAVHADVLYLLCACTTNSKVQSPGLHAIDMTTGKSLWFVPQNPARHGLISNLSNGFIYISSIDKENVHGSIDALRLTDGRHVWTYAASELVYPQVAGGVLYGHTGLFRGIPLLFALDTSSGKRLWQDRLQTAIEYMQVEQ
jgi:outer membrane protein assembly factor BamB